MRVAIPESRRRVSPVFDAAKTLLVIDLDDGHEDSRYRIEMPSGSLADRVKRLISNGVEVLLCGAISRPLCNMLEAASIKVVPFLSGRVEVLLDAFVEDRLNDPRFLMPGCCGEHRRRRNRRRENVRGEREQS